MQLDDWQKLQLTQQTTYGGLQPKRDPLKFKGMDTVQTMLSSFNITHDTLYYEALDVPLPEFEKTCKMKVGSHADLAWLPPSALWRIPAALQSAASLPSKPHTPNLLYICSRHHLALQALWSIVYIADVALPEKRGNLCGGDTFLVMRVTY